MHYQIKLKGFADRKKPFKKSTLEEFIKEAKNRQYQHKNLLPPFIELQKVQTKEYYLGML
jgi:hypothetical protein